MNKIRSCLAVILSVVAIATMFTGCGKLSPKEQAGKAYELFSEEMEAYREVVLDELDLEELYDYISENPVHEYFDLSFTAPDDEESQNFSITVDSISDKTSKSFDAQVEIGTYGISLLLGNIMYSDNTMYFKSNKFLGLDVYSFECDNFIENFNNSAWSSFIGAKIDDATAETINEVEATDVNSIKDLSEEFWQELRANENYTALKDKKEFELDGKEVKCSGIEVSIDKDFATEAFNSYIEGLQDIIKSAEVDELSQYLEELEDIEFYDDFVFDMYLDSKGRIVNIATVQDIEMSSETISFDINFAGTGRRTDSIEGEIYVKTDEDINRITISRNAGISDVEYNEELELVLDNNSDDDTISIMLYNNWNRGDLSFEVSASIMENGVEEAGLYADGAFTDVVKGESCTFNISNAKLVSEDENTLIISGVLKVEPTDSVVEIPESSIDLFGMSQDDITSLLYSVIIKFSQIGIY
jgi:hypothetical protein